MVDAVARQWMADLEARTANPVYFMGMKRLQGIVARELCLRVGVKGIGND
jgi:hypothetical protein